MDYEKLYKEALERARTLLTNEVAADIFPELGESERIRKELLAWLKSRDGQTLPIDRYNAAVAWLEKQGTSYTKKDVDDAYLEVVTNTKDEIEKQYEATYQIRKDIATFIFNYRGDIKDRAKWMDYLGIKVSFVEMQGGQETLCDKCRKEHPSHSCQDITELGRCAVEHEQKTTDKVEPKFHEGEWVQIDRGHVIKILEVEEEIPCYKILNYYGSESLRKISDIDSIAHLWTIQDAKDGDVLYLQKDGKEHIIIYKGVTKERFRTFVSAHCAYNGIVDAFCFADVSRYTDIAYRGIMPATKEQRDILFQRMKEAGYEWDAEKKELKGIEPAEWSEEDEQMLNHVISDIESLKEQVYCKTLCDEEVDFLKSIKDRVQPQPKHEWSEEDKKMLEELLNYCDTSIHYNGIESPQAIEWKKRKEWLISLRPQKTWKPSDAQMQVLVWCRPLFADPKLKDILESLINDLKKLREE